MSRGVEGASATASSLPYPAQSPSPPASRAKTDWRQPSWNDQGPTQPTLSAKRGFKPRRRWFDKSNDVAS
eukprot:5811992-Amphidinium_carterae.1